MKIDYVKLLNDDFFTRERVNEWKIFIATCCKNICQRTIAKIDPCCFVSYFVSSSLIEEVVGDAIIGMSKIINKTPHPIEHPNAFKIAAYLGYWFCRHKPISILYPNTTDLNKLTTAPSVSTEPDYLSWQIKHINEAVAVNIVTSFIFDFERPICTTKDCNRIKNKDKYELNSNFVFDNFEQQRTILIQKLTYYFTYRAIAPKVIEHMLEGYAFHPAWGLTGSHWETEKTKAKTSNEDM